MYNIVYNTINNYFKSLTLNGYISYEETDKVLYLLIVLKITNEYFPGFIAEVDYKDIEKSLYKIFGTSCLIPYPRICNYSNMNKLHAKDTIDLINTITNQINIQNKNIDNFKSTVNSDLYVIQNTKVLKSDSEDETTVPDIVIK